MGECQPLVEVVADVVADELPDEVVEGEGDMGGPFDGNGWVLVEGLSRPPERTEVPSPRAVLTTPAPRDTPLQVRTISAESIARGARGVAYICRVQERRGITA
jgi:hypothetical protein